MKQDTPIQCPDTGWVFRAPVGREICAGHGFDGNGGYRVILKFADSQAYNLLSVEMARLVMRTLREQEVRNEDAIAIAGVIANEADLCELMNAGWRQKGSPPGGFDSWARGNA